MNDRRNNFGLGDNHVRKAGHVGCPKGIGRPAPRGWRGLWFGTKHTSTNLSLWLWMDFCLWVQVIERGRSIGSPPSGTGNEELVWNPAPDSSASQVSYGSLARSSGLSDSGQVFLLLWNPVRSQKKSTSSSNSNSVIACISTSIRLFSKVRTRPLKKF